MSSAPAVAAAQVLLENVAFSKYYSNVVICINIISELLMKAAFRLQFTPTVCFYFFLY